MFSHDEKFPPKLVCHTLHFCRQCRSETHVYLLSVHDKKCNSNFYLFIFLHENLLDCKLYHFKDAIWYPFSSDKTFIDLHFILWWTNLTRNKRRSRKQQFIHFSSSIIFLFNIVFLYLCINEKNSIEMNIYIIDTNFPVMLLINFKIQWYVSNVSIKMSKNL